eukprot:CAMPEP_0179023532 /NCGR_PEP_ID=MMETSP0796-20121207/6980_1 /TAXON_ID=73915 /ORGANISM="Pyrodinium bahamense, Strain pbaha01" /LENGTH=210 /DNA_ID=CAMNT_0020719449 /DNA_START=546 /DNA_END=1177 /DNA_ORIENTATION=-
MSAVILWKETPPPFFGEPLQTTAVECPIALSSIKEAPHLGRPAIHTVLVPQIQEEACVRESQNFAILKVQQCSHCINVVVDRTCTCTSSTYDYLLSFSNVRGVPQLSERCVEDRLAPEEQIADNCVTTEACPIAIWHIDQGPIVKSGILMGISAEHARHGALLREPPAAGTKRRPGPLSAVRQGPLPRWVAAIRVVAPPTALKVNQVLVR